MKQLVFHTTLLLRALLIIIINEQGQEEVERTLKTALQMGYRLIDTATLYGNEAFIGEALKKLGVGGVGGNPNEPTGELGLRREDLFITSKAIFFFST